MLQKCAKKTVSLDPASDAYIREVWDRLVSANFRPLPTYSTALNMILSRALGQGVMLRDDDLSLPAVECR